MITIIRSNLIDDIIQFSVEEFGKIVHGDRAFYVECDVDQKSITQTYQWCSKTVKPSSLEFQKSIVDKKSWLYRKVSQDLISIKSIEELDYNDGSYRKELEADNIQALIAVILRDGSKILGVVGSEFLTRRSLWSEAMIPSMRAIANIIKNSVLKRSIERELLESEQRYRALFEHSPIAFGVHQFGRIVYVNPACVNILKAENSSQLIGKPVMSIVHPDFQEFARKRIEEVAKTGKNVGIAKEKFLCVNGDILDVEVISNPVMLEGQLAFQVVFRDITEEKKAQEQLQQSEMRLRALFEDSIDAIYISSIEGQLIEVNQSFLDLFGYSKQDIQNLNARELYFNLNDRKRFQELIETQNVVRNYETELKRKNGTSIRCVENATLRKNRTGDVIGYQGIIRDITEETRAKEALLRAQKLESLGILAGGIAHDFNNLLMGIIGNASLAKQYLEQDSESFEIVESIRTTSERAANLTKQLLAYSGKGKFLIEPQNISDLIVAMKELLRVSVHKSIDLIYELAEKIPSIMVDKTQIEQVILNLVTNASEAIGDRIGTIKVTTGIEYLDRAKLDEIYYTQELHEAEYVYIFVEDTGAGIEKQMQRKIFDPFFSTKFQGRGLGLAAVLGIIRSHNGCITVESSLERGSTFKVYLPKSDQANPPTNHELSKNDQKNLWEGSGSILFCDDDEIVTSAASLMLSKLGFNVVTAQNGIEALETLDTDTTEFNLVILDMTMPKMSGKETYIKIKEKYPNLKIVLSSGYSEESVKMKFENYKIDGFLQKPYTIETIVQVLKSIINRE